MKIKPILILIIAGIFFAHAEPQKTFTSLMEIDKLSYTLNSIVKNHLLSAIFPQKSFFRTRVKNDLIGYNTQMRQIAVNLKKNGEHDLLSGFTTIGNKLKELEDAQKSDDYLELVAQIRAVDTKTENAIKPKTSALTPTQSVRFALGEIKKRIELIIIEYLSSQIEEKKDKGFRQRLAKNINEVEKDLRTCISYAYWDQQDKMRLLQLTDSWSVLKDALKQTKIPLIVNFGADHMASLLLDLEKTPVFTR